MTEEKDIMRNIFAVPTSLLFPQSLAAAAECESLTSCPYSYDLTLTSTGLPRPADGLFTVCDRCATDQKKTTTTKNPLCVGTDILKLNG